MINRAAIEEALRSRIEETKTWVSDPKENELSGAKFRGKPARLRVIKFLQDDRVEANGVRFRLSFGKGLNQYFTDLEIRFNPKWLMVEGSDDVAPYIAVYALEQNGAGDLLKVFSILDPAQIGNGIDLGDWYVGFINRSIKRGEDKKIMEHTQTAETS